MVARWTAALLIAQVSVACSLLVQPEPKLDDDGRPPVECASSPNYPGACVIECTAGECGTEIVCPPGVPCRIYCMENDACKYTAIDCTAASSCYIDCNGNGSCQGGIACAGDECEVRCIGMGACAGGGGVDCSAETAGAKTCTIYCEGSNACSDGVCCSGGDCGEDCTPGPEVGSCDCPA